MSSMLWLKLNWLSNHGSIDRALAPEEKGLQGFDCQVKVNHIFNVKVSVSNNAEIKGGCGLFYLHMKGYWKANAKYVGGYKLLF